MPAKHSTRLHEVVAPKFGLIVFCGSRNACLRFTGNRPDQGLIIRPAGR
jgi:hypothetical protein